MFKTLVVSALMVATAAVAETPSDTTASNSQQNADPNETICRYQPVIGSRVNRVRVCRTRAEWANSQAVNARGGRRDQNRNEQD